MNEQNNRIVPWNDQTNIFDFPDATCELILEGNARTVSIVLWEGYCYLKVADLSGLWAITRTYDGTDLAQFVAEHIEQGEVGRVWDFDYCFSKHEYMTRKILESEADPLFPVTVVSIVRNDNSARVRGSENGAFVEAMPVSLDKQQPTKAHIPSIWHPSRKNIKQRRLARLARLQAYPPVPKEELFAWKKGSLPEAVDLLETFYFYAITSNILTSSHGLVLFDWPLKRVNLRIPSYMQPRMDVIPFLQAIWDHHHFDHSNWLPARYVHYSAVTNKREDWERAADYQQLTLRDNTYKSGHERLELALKLQDMFKGKISDTQINQLLIDRG